MNTIKYIFIIIAILVFSNNTYAVTAPTGSDLPLKNLVFIVQELGGVESSSSFTSAWCLYNSSLDEFNKNLLISSTFPNSFLQNKSYREWLKERLATGHENSWVTYEYHYDIPFYVTQNYRSYMLITGFLWYDWLAGVYIVSDTVPNIFSYFVGMLPPSPDGRDVYVSIGYSTYWEYDNFSKSVVGYVSTASSSKSTWSRSLLTPAVNSQIPFLPGSIEYDNAGYITKITDNSYSFLDTNARMLITVPVLHSSSEVVYNAEYDWLLLVNASVVPQSASIAVSWLISPSIPQEWQNSWQYLDFSVNFTGLPFGTRLVLDDGTGLIGFNTSDTMSFIPDLNLLNFDYYLFWNKLTYNWDILDVHGLPLPPPSIFDMQWDWWDGNGASICHTNSLSPPLFDTELGFFDKFDISQRIDDYLLYNPILNFFSNFINPTTPLTGNSLINENFGIAGSHSFNFADYSIYFKVVGQFIFAYSLYLYFIIIIHRG